MIGDVLVFLRKHLDAHLRVALGGDVDDGTDDRVVFVDGDKFEPITFKQGAVSELLINLEEERILRNAEPYTRWTDDGKPQNVQPDIRLVLYVLFVARFKRYEVAWEHLSKIVEHFQTLRLFERESTPELPVGVEKLGLELVTLDFAQQNEVWNALRTTHHPSVLYRMRLLALRDQGATAQTQVANATVQVRRIS